MLRCSAFFLTLLISVSGFTQEKIKSFTSQIQVDIHGTTTVTETIEVFATGDKIKRGIFRSLIVEGINDDGKSIKHGLRVISVKRNGGKEPFFIEKEGRVRKIYIGEESPLLVPSNQTYEIKYEMNNVIRAYENKDVFAWNITGNVWDFTIDEVTATIQMPFKLSEDSSIEVFQGKLNEKNQFQGEVVQNDQRLTLHQNLLLESSEGVTVYINSPKGVYTLPSFWKRNFPNPRLLKNLAISLFILFLYYFFFWLKVGRDPSSKTIIPRYDIPQRYTPAQVGCMHRMKVDLHCFTSMLLDWIAKNYILYDHSTYGSDTLKKNPSFKKQTLKNRDEESLFSTLFDQGTLIFSPAYHSRLVDAYDALKEDLQKKYIKPFFLNNNKYNVVGACLSVVLILLHSNDYQLPNKDQTIEGLVAIGLTLFYSLFFFGIFQTRPLKNAILPFMFTLIHFSIFVLGFWKAGILDISVMPLVILFLIINVLFFQWMKAPTVKGREILDELEGYKMFLLGIDNQQTQSHGPEKNIALFETHYAYAYALGIEKDWEKSFANEIQQALQTQSPRSNLKHLTNVGFAYSFGSQVSNAVHPPSSSSSGGSGSSFGGGGGGSGGGSGGGGGGGW